MLDLIYRLTDLLLLMPLYYIIALLYHYFNIRSSIIFCLFPGSIYLSYDIFLSNRIFSVSFVIVYELFQREIPKTYQQNYYQSHQHFLLLFIELLFLKWFLEHLWQLRLHTNQQIDLASRSLWQYLRLKVLFIFLSILFCSYVQQKKKTNKIWLIFDFQVELNHKSFFNFGLKVWSVNHTSINENLSQVLKHRQDIGAIVNHQEQWLNYFFSIVFQSYFCDR